MSNLLPAEAKKRAWTAARSRVLLTASLVLVSSVLVALAALLPAALSYRIAAAELDARVASLPTRAPGVSAELAHSQALVAQLAPIVATASSTQALEALLSARPPGITIRAIAYAAGRPSTISLSGNSETPELLDAYRTALLADGRFPSVSVPINALVGSRDGHFSMTVSGSF